MTRRKHRITAIRPAPGGAKVSARSTWGQALHSVRPVLLLIALVTLAVLHQTPELYEPPDFLLSEPETVSGRFTRCGAGHSHYCVIDGDTFRIGERRVRVVGIDTAESDSPCEAERAQAAASAAALQAWLNRGPFTMTARVDEPRDRYGRELRIVSRLNAQGGRENLAEWMRQNGGARRYWGERRQNWCA